MSEYLSVFSPDTEELLKKDAKLHLLSKAKQLISSLRTGIDIASIYKEGTIRGTLAQTDQDLMGVLYGEQAIPLGDKSKFPILMRSLGYKAPDSFLITAATSPQEKVSITQQYYEQKGIDHIFCKPLNGTRQRDLKAFQINDPTFASYLESREEDTLVQEFMAHEKVLRYIRYRNVAGRVFVACFEYMQDDPNQKRPKLPFIGQRKLLASGETINEYVSSIKGTQSIPLSEADGLENINNFMAQAIDNLEKNLGVELPFFSCDLGVKEMASLKDQQTIKDSLIFFETQTIPNPWKVNSRSALMTYRNIWQLFLKEHSFEMIPRLQNLKRKKRNN